MHPDTQRISMREREQIYRVLLLLLVEMAELGQSVPNLVGYRNKQSTLFSACSRTEHVFMIITSACDSSFASTISFSFRRPSMISLSDVFI